MATAQKNTDRKSAIYEGIVYHRRLTPTEHKFRFPLFLFSIDLDEVNQVFSIPGIISTRRFSLIRFCRADYLGDPEKPLYESVREKVREEAGIELNGPIRLVAHPRYLGLVFNPIAVYYCFSAEEKQLEAVVAEVTNTPWGERHCYVIPWQSEARVKHHQCSKEMHVSPFMPMDLNYHWRLTAPDKQLSILLEDHDSSGKIFDAALLMNRKQITGKNLFFAICRYPFMTAQVMLAIYWQALRLWWKKVPFYSHPKHSSRRTLTPEVQSSPIPE